MLTGPLTPLAAAAAGGSLVALLVVRAFGDGAIGPGGLAATLAGSLLVLGLSAAQLARPRHSGAVSAGAASLVAATTLVATGALLAEESDGPRWLWVLLAGAAVGVAAAGAVTYVRPAVSATSEARPARLEDGDVPESVRPESVEVLLEAMRSLLDGEDTRAQSLNARAIGLGGFAAILVALLVPAARDLGDGRGPDPLLASVVLVAAAAVLLVSSVLVVLLGVVVTRQVTTVSIEEVELWETRPFVEKSPTWVRGRLLTTLRKALVSERITNNRRAAALTVAVALVAAGVLCAAVGGLTLLL